MELILWRHASANTYQNGQRILDPKGHQQAQASGAWLQIYYPECTVWTSQLQRTQETASYYSNNFIIQSFLNPENNENDIFSEIRNSEESALIVTGHQMWIGALVAELAHNQSLLFFGHSQIAVFARHQNKWRLINQFMPKQ